MNALSKKEVAFLKADSGFDRLIQTKDGKIHADKKGRRIFVGWNADDVRQMNPAMREAVRR